MAKEKRETLKSKRENKLYLHGLVLSGNGKLLDYYDEETGTDYKYAQFNTRAIIDCPFRSKGCEAVCYATKGNHRCPSVKESRMKSYEDSKRYDFAEAMIYTIETEKTSKRYKDSVMLLRVHESGDFYSLRYLKEWVKVWKYFLEKFEETGEIIVQFPNYTKSFPFLNMLTDEEIDVINRAMRAGIVAINLSIDDTTSKEQKIEYLKCIARMPLLNTYGFTENVETFEHDNVCDCADCAKCGTCNKATGKKTVVKIHSASNADMEVYRNNVK